MLTVFSDESFMKQAFNQAKLAFDAGELPIGAVVVSNNKIIARAHNQNLIITTIGQRCFPLINYDTEDLLSKENKGFLFELSNLGGKARDIFNLLDIHGNTNQTSVIILDHIFKQIDCLRSLHYKIDKDHNLCIYYSYFNEAPSQSMLMKTLKNGLLIEGIEIDPKFIKFSEISVPIKTLAGKRKAFIKDI